MTDSGVSPWKTFGAVLRQWREKNGLSLRGLANQTHWSFSLLAHWERGEQHPHADAVKRLDAALGSGGELVAAALDAWEAEAERLRADLRRARRGTFSAKRSAHDGEDDTERRRFLQLAATGAGLGTFGPSGEPVRQLIDLSLGQEFRAVEEWELVCTDQLNALRTQPPAQVAADLIVDLSAVQRQLGVSAPAEVPGLQRVTAALSAIHANALTRMGDHAAAIRWWRTARRAADASGDLRLRLLVRGEEAGHGLYGQRPPETILRLIEDAQRIMGADDPSVDLLTTQAKALSLLGRHDEALKTLDALNAAADGGVTADPLGFWSPSQIYFAESWVHAAAGNETKADTARDRVLGRTRDYQYRANVQLHGALCMIVNGGTAEGIRHAATVIDTLAPAYRSRHIIETAHIVLRAVPRDQQTHPTVSEFRELLTITPPPNT